MKAVKVDDYYEVMKGLKAGEQVVTSANFLIDSESNLKEAMGGMADARNGTREMEKVRVQESRVREFKKL